MLVKITSRAWALNILALMDSGVPARQAPLLSATKAGRTAFRASLDHLIDLSLLERNPGHGHPLRPEYRLTALGQEIAPLAGKIMKTTSGENANALIRKSWTLPILAVTKEPRHFIEIKRELAPVTDRALSQTLQHLHRHDWLHRDVDLSAQPLRPTYRATNMGHTLSTTLNMTSINESISI